MHTLPHIVFKNPASESFSHKVHAQTMASPTVLSCCTTQVLCSLDAWLSGASGSAISSVSHITTEKLKLATQVLKMRAAMEKGEILLCRWVSDARECWIGTQLSSNLMHTASVAAGWFQTLGMSASQRHLGGALCEAKQRLQQLSEWS